MGNPRADDERVGRVRRRGGAGDPRVFRPPRRRPRSLRVSSYPKPILRRELRRSVPPSRAPSPPLPFGLHISATAALRAFPTGYSDEQRPHCALPTAKPRGRRRPRLEATTEPRSRGARQRRGKPSLAGALRTWSKLATLRRVCPPPPVDARARTTTSGARERRRGRVKVETRKSGSFGPRRVSPGLSGVRRRATWRFSTPARARPGSPCSCRTPRGREPVRGVPAQHDAENFPSRTIRHLRGHRPGANGPHLQIVHPPSVPRVGSPVRGGFEERRALSHAKVAFRLWWGGKRICATNSPFSSRRRRRRHGWVEDEVQHGRIVPSQARRQRSRREVHVHQVLHRRGARHSHRHDSRTASWPRPRRRGRRRRPIESSRLDRRLC